MSRFYAISHESDTLCFHPRPPPKLAPTGELFHHMQMVVNMKETSREASRCTPETPRGKRETLRFALGNMFQLGAPRRLS